MVSEERTCFIVEMESGKRVRGRMRVRREAEDGEEARALFILAEKSRMAQHSKHLL
jgi:hypothetical protein